MITGSISSLRRQNSRRLLQFPTAIIYFFLIHSASDFPRQFLLLLTFQKSLLSKNYVRSSLVAQMVKILPTKWETLVQSLDWDTVVHKGFPGGASG